MAMTAKRRMPAAASRNSCSRLLAISVDRLDSPVTLPPGRAKLATTPPPTGSVPNAKTMGIASVACLNVATAIELETMRSTLSRTNSAAISAWRAGCPSGERYSIAMVRLRSSRVQPGAAQTQQSKDSNSKQPRIRWSAACRLLRARGQRCNIDGIATAPPMNVMNSRRRMTSFIRSPRRRAPTNREEPRCQVPWQS